MSNFWRWLTFLWSRKEPVVQISAPTSLIWPIRPNRGVRQIDAAGDGSYGASRDGGVRQHLGLDLISHPGDDVVAPCACEITHVGLAYAGSYLGSVHLKGWDTWGGYTFKLLYLEPEVTVGEILRAGEVLGSSQSVASYYAAKGVHGLTNHIHFEAHDGTGPVDPLPLLEGGEGDGG